MQPVCFLMLHNEKVCGVILNYEEICFHNNFE